LVQELVVYPDQRVHIACTDVRKFDEKLAEVLENMIDTMKEHSLEALSAIQIAYPYNIVIIKDGNNYKEYINPRLIGSSGKMEVEEETSYYPGLKIKVPRYKTLKLVYQDKDGNNLSANIEDEKLSSTMQRKLDYLYGGTFLDKVDKKTQERVEESLSKNSDFCASGDVCPTFSRKDYFVSFTDKILFFMVITLLAPLFKFSKSTLDNIYLYDKIAYPAVIILMIGFFIYAWYESKKYRQCSSCQIGNNIGVMIKRVVAGTVFAAIAYFIF